MATAGAGKLGGGALGAEGAAAARGRSAPWHSNPLNCSSVALKSVSVHGCARARGPDPYGSRQLARAWPFCVLVVGHTSHGLRDSACVVLHAYIVVSVAGAFVIVCTLLACRCVSLGDVRREGA